MAKNRTTVRIAGRDYPVASTESVDYIREIAALVDQKVQDMRTQQHVFDPYTAMTFAALNLADELTRLRKLIEGTDTAEKRPRHGRKEE